MADYDKGASQEYAVAAIQKGIATSTTTTYTVAPQSPAFSGAELQSVRNQNTRTLRYAVEVSQTTQITYAMGSIVALDIPPFDIFGIAVSDTGVAAAIQLHGTSTTGGNPGEMIFWGNGVAAGTYYGEVSYLV